MKVLVCGSRVWTDPKPIREALAILPQGTVIIEGGANGADRLARGEAERMGLEVVEVRADWNRYSRAAGPLRNEKMLVMGPDKVLAFIREGYESRGTRHMVKIAREAGVEVIVYEQ